MGILINTGFDVGSSSPIDSKAKVQTIDERNALVSDGLAYESLRTYVESEKKWYEYDGSTWNEITEGGGSDGASAYESAVKLGYKGTEEEWIASLKGKSAYELAVEEGYDSTQDDWLQSLKGSEGFALIPTTQIDDQIGRIWLAN